jgi:hypothetical protein
MRPRNDLDPRRDDQLRIVTVALLALFVGTLLGPGVAAAASSAWVRVKNWPALQKVLVMNSASAPVYTQPPAHTIVNLHGGGTIPSAQFDNQWTPLYTVPAGKWLVITQMRCEGYGAGPISFIDLSTYTGIHETFPLNPYIDSGITNVTSVVQGPAYVPPGTVLYLAMFRNTAPSSIWSATAWIDGYLTDRP